MQYLKRDIDAFLSAWKADAQRKPLIIRGARQVGKTASIRHFAAERYSHVVEINFVEEPKYKNICTDGYAAGDIIKNISLLDPSKTFEPGNTCFSLMSCRNFRISRQA